MADLQGLVDSVVAQTSGLPPAEIVRSWQPALSGDIDIRIRSDGAWEHEGSPIHREGLVRLFASLLRRESDGEYYLVTPVEKWRIAVERHPLVVIDCEFWSAGAADGATGEASGTAHSAENSRSDERAGRWVALLNTGGRCQIGGENQLTAEGEAGEPYLTLSSGLSAQITRAAWYRLIESAVQERAELVIYSGEERIRLGSLEDAQPESH